MTKLRLQSYCFVLSDLFSQSSPQEDGLFGSEGTPFAKKGGLFSGGGNLFDDFEDKYQVTGFNYFLLSILLHLGFDHNTAARMHLNWCQILPNCHF